MSRGLQVAGRKRRGGVGEAHSEDVHRDNGDRHVCGGGRGLRGRERGRSYGPGYHAQLVRVGYEGLAQAAHEAGVTSSTSSIRAGVVYGTN